MAPYIVLSTLATIVAGVAYGSGWIDVPIFYAIMFPATILAGAGYARWDAKQRPPRR